MLQNDPFRGHLLACTLIKKPPDLVACTLHLPPKRPLWRPFCSVHATMQSPHPQSCEPDLWPQMAGRNHENGTPPRASPPSISSELPQRWARFPPLSPGLLPNRAESWEWVLRGSGGTSPSIFIAVFLLGFLLFLWISSAGARVVWFYFASVAFQVRPPKGGTTNRCGCVG